MLKLTVKDFAIESLPFQLTVAAFDFLVDEFNPPAERAHGARPPKLSVAELRVREFQRQTAEFVNGVSSPEDANKKLKTVPHT